MLEALREIDDRHFIYYSGRKRNVRSFSGFYEDFNRCLQKIRNIEDGAGTADVNMLALIGPTSYDWLCIEFACLRGGICLIAIPENLSKEDTESILETYNPATVLIDHAYSDKLSLPNRNVWHYRCPEATVQSNNFDHLSIKDAPITPSSTILDRWSIGFSSGTSGSVKHIPIEWKKTASKPPAKGLKSLMKWYRYKTGLWSRKDNRMLLFLPLTHTQQRMFVRMALMRKISIIITTPEEALLKLIIEKPNIMIGVPLFFEILAKQIQRKLDTFQWWERILHRVYLNLGIPKLEEWNPVKRLFQRLLFRKVSSIYGGRGSYFVTGSAAIDRQALDTFYQVGVKIREGYGQSEIGIISMNAGRKYRLGSVGKPAFPVKISSEGEILVKFDPTFHNRNILPVDEDDYIHTRDIGRIDKDGFLYLTGRLDDVIVLESGKKIFPENLEKQIKQTTDLEWVTVFSADNIHLRAIVYGKDTSSDRVSSQLAEMNRNVASHETIRSFTLASEPPSPENGQLTNTLKPKRAAIIGHYSEAQFQPTPRATAIPI